MRTTMPLANGLPASCAAPYASMAGIARAVLPPEGKDAGVVSGVNPFTTLTESWPGYADTLAEINGWPRWEAQRQAALLMEEVPA